jgi:hypothetical protein
MGEPLTGVGAVKVHAHLGCMLLKRYQAEGQQLDAITTGGRENAAVKVKELVEFSGLRRSA